MLKNKTELDYSGTPNGLLTTRELASLLKFSERHIANLVRSRRIPRIKIGHAVRFDGDAVLRALKAYEEEEIKI
ncbi:helix-turn-helix domain-containing protein [Opitutales bacterium]|nr:helix-turn-helix domain-containing protein [Opitutales bacterium]